MSGCSGCVGGRVNRAACWIECGAKRKRGIKDNVSVLRLELWGGHLLGQGRMWEREHSLWRNIWTLGHVKFEVPGKIPRLVSQLSGQAGGLVCNQCVVLGRDQGWRYGFLCQGPGWDHLELNRFLMRVVERSLRRRWNPGGLWGPYSEKQEKR